MKTILRIVCISLAFMCVRANAGFWTGVAVGSLLSDDSPSRSQVSPGAPVVLHPRTAGHGILVCERVSVPAGQACAAVGPQEPDTRIYVQPYVKVDTSECTNGHWDGDWLVTGLLGFSESETHWLAGRPDTTWYPCFTRAEGLRPEVWAQRQGYSKIYEVSTVIQNGTTYLALEVSQ